jgi:hypothetical protein
LDEQLSIDELKNLIRKELGEKIITINDHTKHNETIENQVLAGTLITRNEVEDIYNTYCNYIEGLSNEITSLDANNVTITILKNMTDKIREIPTLMNMTKTKLEEIMGSMENVEAQINPTDTDEDEDMERKPPAVVNSNQRDNVSAFGDSTHDQTEDDDDQRSTRVSIVQTEYAFGTTPPEIGIAIPEFRPTMEDEPINALAEKIKASPFGRMKGSRELKEPIEIILAYATYLYAIIGALTVSNISTPGNKSDWFHINERYRRNYINAFYASYSNYHNSVRKGYPYRKENINNGFIAAVTLMTSTAIGASDEIFLTAVDQDNWKKTVYPYISGRRKLTRAEVDTKQVIDKGTFQRVQGRNGGKIHDSILDFFNHTKALADMELPEHTVNITRFNITRDDSDNGPDTKTEDYFEVSKRKATTVNQEEVTEIGSTSRTLRKRKKPPSDTQSAPSTPKPVHVAKPRSTTKKSGLKRIVGRGRGRTPMKSTSPSTHRYDETTIARIAGGMVTNEQGIILFQGQELVGPSAAVEAIVYNASNKVTETTQEPKEVSNYITQVSKEMNEEAKKQTIVDDTQTNPNVEQISRAKRTACKSANDTTATSKKSIEPSTQSNED